MKKIVCILSVFMVVVSCKSYDPQKEADLINHEVEQKLDSLYHSDTESVLLHKGLKDLKSCQTNLVKQKKQLFESEKLSTFNDGITNLEELEIFKKFKSKIQKDQRRKYSKLSDGIYIKDNQDIYSIFILQKDWELKKKQGIFSFYNRKGALSYEIISDLLYFEGSDKPIFIKQVSNNSFSLIDEDLLEATFIKGNKDIVAFGDFKPHGIDDDPFKFTVSIKEFKKISLDNKEYPCSIDHKQVFFDGEYFDEYWIQINKVPYTETHTMLLSLLKDSNNNNHYDGMRSGKYLWMRVLKEIPNNITEILK